MQGSYKNNGLPRPYYMKPTKRGSAYDNASRLFFLTNSRKLTGYFVMLVLFGLCMFMVAQELKPHPEPSFEIMEPLEVKTSKNNGDVAKLVDSADKKDTSREQPQVANNKAQNSRGEYGHAVMEAPKGGMVNEGPVVGADEGLVVNGKAKKPGQGVDADRVASDGTTIKGSAKNGIKSTLNNDNAKLGNQAVQAGDADLKKLNEVLDKSSGKKDNIAARKGDVASDDEDLSRSKKLAAEADSSANDHERLGGDLNKKNKKIDDSQIITGNRDLDSDAKKPKSEKTTGKEKSSEKGEKAVNLDGDDELATDKKDVAEKGLGKSKKEATKEKKVVKEPADEEEKAVKSDKKVAGSKNEDDPDSVDRLFDKKDTPVAKKAGTEKKEKETEKAPSTGNNKAAVQEIVDETEK